MWCHSLCLKHLVRWVIWNKTTTAACHYCRHVQPAVAQPSWQRSLPCPAPSWRQLFPPSSPALSTNRTSARCEPHLGWNQGTLPANFHMECAIKNVTMSLSTRLLWVLSHQREIPLTSQPRLIHVTAFGQYVHLRTTFQGWGTRSIKFHQKSLINTLRAHCEWQPLPSNQSN